jgi:hypothetical protein
MLNERWRRKPEPLPTGPADSAKDWQGRVEVWHEYSGMTSTAAACEMQGDIDCQDGTCAADRQAAYRKRKAAGNGSTNGR